MAGALPADTATLAVKKITLAILPDTGLTADYFNCFLQKMLNKGNRY